MNNNSEFVKKILKNKFLLIGIVLVIGFALFLIFNKDNIFKNGVVLVENEKKIVENINIDNKLNELTVISSRIEKIGKVSSIYVKVKNNTDQEISETNLKLSIYDKDNKVLLISNINKVDKFGVGDEREFQVSTNNDISNAYKYVVEKSN